MQDKQAALIHAKQRTPTKKPKPVTPSKTAPNLNHLMATRKLEKDLKKRISDLQVHMHPCSNLCGSTYCMSLPSIRAAGQMTSPIAAWGNTDTGSGAGGPGSMPCGHGRRERAQQCIRGECEEGAAGSARRRAGACACGERSRHSEAESVRPHRPGESSATPG